MARILVADDDVDIRELVEFKLSTMGHDIVAVGDGAAAIDACMAQKPDLAVLDVMMPGVSGLDAIRAIRAEPNLADLPVILLTARAQESDVETGFDSGADDYITKPFSPRELASRVQALLVPLAMTIGHIGYWAAVTVGLGCLVVVISLVVIRLHADATERRTRELRTPLWRVVLTLGAGEPDEVEAATAGCCRSRRTSARRSRTTRSRWCPSCGASPGSGCARCCGRGGRSTRPATPPPARRRSGVPAATTGWGCWPCRSGATTSWPGSHDRDFTARRTAMLALASFPEHDVIEQMLLAATVEPRLRHDFLAAVDQIGGPAAAVMVEHLRAPTSEDPGRERRLAAEAVGLVGEIDAVSSLEACLVEDDDELRIAALQALGELGTPSSIIVVTAQLGATSRDVRQAGAWRRPARSAAPPG